jgi:Ca2+-binding RTX toxin-like protein
VTAGPSPSSVIRTTLVRDAYDVTTLEGIAGSFIHLNDDDIEGLRLVLGDEADAVQIEHSRFAIDLETAGGDDRILVSSDQGSVDEIQADLNIDAGAGANDLVVDDSADPDADNDVRITSNSIVGLAPADIRYTATGGGFESRYDADTGQFASGIEIRAGSGGNRVTVEGTRNDPGLVEVTTVKSGSGDDQVSVVSDDNRYLIVDGQGGRDLLDAGSTTTGVALFGGDDSDLLLGGSGDDILVGGLGSDGNTLPAGEGVNGGVFGGAGNDVLLGDEALIRRDAGFKVQRIETANESIGGDDDLFGESGNDVLIGGAGADSLSADPAQAAGPVGGIDIILGDNGVVVRDDGSAQANDVYSRSAQAGGIDRISGGDGDNIIIGGAFGDIIDGGAGNEVILGDAGYVTRNADDEVELVATGTVDDPEGAIGGVDVIDGGAGADIIFGGAAGDEITALLGGKIILGDNGVAVTGGDVYTTDPGAGGADSIVGGGDGVGNIILGGGGTRSVSEPLLDADGNPVLDTAGDPILEPVIIGDEITGGTGNDVLVGDGGYVTRIDGIVLQVATTGRPETGDVEGAVGGDDRITSTGGDNVIIGGAGADRLTAPVGSNIILGDNGVVGLNNAASETAALDGLNDIYTTSPEVGGNDAIIGGDGANILIGGAGSDRITGGAGDEIIVGDGAYVVRGGVDGGGFATVLRVETGDALRGAAAEDATGAIGGVDIIDGSAGADVILGGAEGDRITAEQGGKIILGDNGVVITGGDVYTTNPEIGGADVITGGGDEVGNIILGGAAGDTLTGGTGDDVLVGDGGYVTREDGVVLQVATTGKPETDDAKGEVGGNDDISSTGGSNVILGGAGADTLFAGLGAVGGNIILGDNGVANLNNRGTGASNDVFTTSPSIGGNDLITGGNGANILIGGGGDDEITGGAGDEVLVGDGATVVRDADEQIVRVVTGGEADHPGVATDASVPPQGIGGSDTIDGGAGRDVILGGAEADRITAEQGGKIILGDNGVVITGGDVYTTNPEIGGADIITGGSDGVGNIILGGGGTRSVSEPLLDADGNPVLDTAGDPILEPVIIGDEITGGTGNDVLVGDGGYVTRIEGIVLQVATTGRPETGDVEGAVGGDDRITSTGGDNVIIGGAGADRLIAPVGSNIILGDNGVVGLNNAGSETTPLDGLNDIYTTSPAVGGNDAIIGGDGANILIGGAGSDSITGGAGDEVLLGDGGYVSRGGVDEGGFAAVLRVETGDAPRDAAAEDATGAIGGADIIDGSAGADVILGGAEGDTITALQGGKIILGDNGVVITGGDVYTTNPEVGAADTITGGADGVGNILLGGAAGDIITGGTGNDVIVGDGGYVTRTAGVVRQVATNGFSQTGDLTGAVGGDDIIDSFDGDNVILGGAGGDTIDAPLGNSIILGDNGVANLNNDGSNDVFTTSPAIGGVDTIIGGTGDNILIGGAFGDTLTGGLGIDTILGDGGRVFRDAQERVTKVETGGEGDETGAIGGIDIIDGAAGADVILGGAEGDTITATTGGKIILGDNGVVIIDGDVFTTNPEVGGADVITGGSDGVGNIIVGGSAGDVITAGSGVDVILGDGGYIQRDADRRVLKIQSGDALRGAVAEDSVGQIGGADLIEGGASGDFILGGAEGDTIRGGLGDDIILGDNGVVDYLMDGDPQTLDLVSTTDATLDPSVGGDDLIFGGEGADLILGGAADDTAEGNLGRDLLLGDNGAVEYSLDGDATTIDRVSATVATNVGDDTLYGNEDDDLILGDYGQIDYFLDQDSTSLDRIQTRHPGVGGDDFASGGAGDDIVLGGSGGDTLEGDEGRDILLGDNGLVDYFADGDSASLDLIISTDPLKGGDDVIRAGAGEDIAFGGTASDDIRGGDGDDILLGDHGEWNRLDLPLFPLPAGQQFRSIFTAATDGGGGRQHPRRRR